jgi:hypothetical protein
MRAGKAGLGWYNFGTPKPSYRDVKKTVYEVSGTGGHGANATSVYSSNGHCVCVTLHIGETEYYQAMTAWVWLKEDHAGDGSRNASPCVFGVRFLGGITKTRGPKETRAM